jgi:hypothetical protein
VSADILSDPTHPHGTVPGFTKGCRGAHCPAPVACREVHSRYKGDFAFRKAMDSGLTAAEVVAQERAAADEARRAAREAAAAARRPKAKVRAAPKPKVRRAATTPFQRDVERLVTVERMTDNQTGDALDKTREQVASVRKYLGIPANHERRQPLATAGVSSS